jgi:hypothetical protein
MPKLENPGIDTGVYEHPSTTIAMGNGQSRTHGRASGIHYEVGLVFSVAGNNVS